jgi:hypothetical protein
MGLVLNDSVLSSSLAALSSASQVLCNNLPGTSSAAAPSATEAADAAYHLRVVGAASLSVVDSAGNSTNPLSDPPDEGLPGITSVKTGETAADVVLLANQVHTVLFRADGPMLLQVSLQSDGPLVTLRYQNLILPSGALARIKLGPTGIDSLVYDGNGDGIFETTVSPTVNLSGTAAADDTPPTVTFSASPGSGVIVNLSAIDGESGVKTLQYAVNGFDFKPYTGPFSVGFNSGSVVYAFAEDNAANRSGLNTYYPAGTNNQLDNAQFFVLQHYVDFLSRDPDAGGLSFWTNQITSCGSDLQCIELRRINVSAAYFLSIEFQETGYLVYRMYKAAYGNLPSAPVPVRYGEFLPDTQQIGNGVQVGVGDWQTLLANNKTAFALDFVSRSRFAAAYQTSLTPVQFVDALFTNAGVTPSATERNAAISEFGGATNTADIPSRARALRRVAENSTLGQQEFNKAFVLMQYFGYLRRNPNDPPEAGLDFGGFNFWFAKLNQFNGNFVNAEMVKAFIVSGEYRQRFVP